MKKFNSLTLPGGLAMLLMAPLVNPALGQGSPNLALKWTVPATTRAYLDTTSNWPRSIAINPVTGHVLIPRASGVDPFPPEVRILSGADGSDIGTLNVTGISGGHASKFPVDQIGVADDGVIYAATLEVNTPVFQIWRWQSETSAPQSVFGPADAGPTASRIGDSFAVRGAGANTQLIGSGGPTQVTTTFTIFTTADGTNFMAHEFPLPEGVGANEAGRGIAWDGAENAFYAIASGSTTVHHIGFNLNDGTSTLLNDVTLNAVSLGISLAHQNGYTILPSIQDKADTAPHGLTVYDLTDPTAPTVVPGGSVSFAGPGVTDGNTTGATAVGAGLVLGLSTHNGVVALALTTVTNPPAISIAPQDITFFPGGASADALFTVTASGTAPFQYQWYFNDAPIANATDKSLTIANVQSANVGAYHVVVTNPKGSVTSAKAHLTLGTTGYPSIITADNPIAYWRLDETGGSVVRDVWGGHNGTYVNATLGVSGNSLLDANKAAGFNSQSTPSYARVPLDPSFDFTGSTTPFTMECWVQFNTVEDRVQRFFSDLDYAVSGNGSGYGFGIANSHSMRFTTYGIQDFDLDLGVENTFIAGKWYHMAGVSDGSGNFNFYVNGQPVGSIAYNGDAVNSTQSMYLGNDAFNFDWLNGQLDEMAIYNTALSAERIAARYHARYGDTTPPLIRTQPASQTNYVTLNAVFSVIAEGSGALTYQWRKDGADLAGKTNATLALRPLKSSDAGDYSVIISGVGSTNSAAAHLAVLPAPSIDLSKDLVLHLKFDGDFQDASGQNNHGTTVGAPTFVADGKIGGKAAHFTTDAASGIFNYVNLGVRPDLQFSSNVDFSVAYWVRMPAGEQPGDVPFIGNATGAGASPGYFFGPTYGNGGWRWTLFNADGTGLKCPGNANSINDGNWHHVVSTFQRAGKGATYLDGLQVSSVSITSIGDLDTGNPTVIGQDPTGTYDDNMQDVVEFDLDDMGVWRRALTREEAIDLYVVGASKGESFISTQVRMEVQMIAGQVRVTWPKGQLQAADTINGTFTDVAGAASPYAVTPAGDKKFYRIRQ